MKIKITITVLLLCFLFTVSAQINGTHVPGTACTNCSSEKVPGSTVMNGTAAISTNYTASVCGLDYVQASVFLSQRGYGPLVNSLSAVQPAILNIAGIPLCKNILKAFLYVSTSGSGAAITASITNPATSGSLIPMTIIGSDVDICWGYNGSYTYRADVTSLISGNGNYTISGIPVSPSADDAHGATLFIIYSDPTQNYTGSIILADGMLTNVGPGVPSIGAAVQTTVTGFNVCATPTLSESFFIVTDLQRFGDFPAALNSTVLNYTVPVASQTPWMFVSDPGSPIVNGQNSARFQMGSGGVDCFGTILTGLYYRTNCLTCPANQLTLTATSACQAASVSVIGGTAPYTYSWTGTAQTTSVVSGLTGGTYTVRAVDTNTCFFGSATVAVSNPAPPVQINTVQPVCIGYSLALIAGPAAFYTWSPSTFLNVTNTPSVAANPLANTIYTLAYTNTLGCVGSQTVQVIVNFVQQISSPDQTVCAGQSLSLSAGSYTGNIYNWSGPNGYSNGTINPVIANISTSMSGVYNVVLITAPGCTLTSVRNVTVVPVPVQTLVANSPICAGNTLSVAAANIGLSYSWSGPNNYLNGSQNFSITNTGTISAGLYSLTTTYSTGCFNTSVIAMVIYTNPIAAITTATNVCQNNPWGLQGAGGGSYFWAGPNGFSSTAQNNTIIAQFVNSGLYQLTVTATNGCQSSVSTSINVLPKPTLSATGATVCYGSPAILTATGSVFFQWTGPNNFNSSNITPNIILPQVTSTVTGNYSLTGVSLLNSCSTTVVVDLSTLALPVISSSNLSVCIGQPATFTASGATSYTWAGPVGYSSLLSNAFVPATNLLTAGIYTVTGAASNSCLATSTVILSTLSLPTLACTGATVCFNQQANLFASGAQTYFWKGPVGYASVTQNINIPFANNLTSGIYTVVGTAANSCTAAVTATLLSLSLPTVVCIGTVVCEGQPAILTSTPTGVGTYLWSGPANYTSSSQNASIPITNSLSIGVYTLTVIAGNSCSNSAMATLTSMPLPVLTAIGATVCMTQPALLTVAGAATYSWTGPGFNTTGPAAFIPSTNSLNAGIYTVTGTAANSCSNIVTTTLIVLSLPTITATSQTVCLNQPAQLNVTGALSYIWFGSSGTFSNTGSFFIPSASNPAPETYTIIGTDINSCTGTATAVIATMPLPVVTLSAGRMKICVGENVTLTAVGAQNYTWMPVGPPPINTVVITPLVNSSYTIQGSDLNGCINTASITIFVSTCTGINEIFEKGNEILIYPNPNNGNFIMTSKTTIQLLLVNTLGQNIKEVLLNEKNSYQVSISDLAEGVYYLISKEKSVNQKIIVEK